MAVSAHGSSFAGDMRLRRHRASFFAMFGAQPVHGRAFHNADRQALVRPLVLSHAVWQSRFGGDPKVLDRVVRIPGTRADDPWMVVGIMAPGFSFPDGANVWVPHNPRAFSFTYGISEATVLRDWRAARAWLARELGRR